MNSSQSSLTFDVKRGGMPQGGSAVLAEYFKSIEHSYIETVRARQRRNWPELLGISAFVLLIFSVLPIIPFALTRVMPLILKSNSAVVFGHQLGISSLWLWWPICSLILFLLLLLLIRWETWSDARNAKKWLSEPQMRFCQCYSIIQEIEKYRTNGLPQHIDKAMQHWHKLLQMLRRMLRPFIQVPSAAFSHLEKESGGKDGDSLPKQHRFVLYPEIDALKVQFPWFRLDSFTESAIKAFYSLPSKVEDRLKDKKDLPEVASCLLFLGQYLYSRIPDVPAHEGFESLADYGNQSLHQLSEELQKLPAYATESKPAKPRTYVWKRVLLGLQALTAPFTHENLLACFMAWYVLTLLLTVGTLRVVLHFLPSVNVDSVLVSLIVGGPLACAVSAVALSRTKKRDDTEPKA